MRTPLAYYYAYNICATYRARLPGTLVDPERILKVTASINPIDTGAAAPDALFEHLANG